MKLTTLFATILGLGLAVSTQAAEETLLSSGGKTSHGGFGAPVMKMTRLDGHSRVMAGIEGAWVINHTVYLGLAGAGTARGIRTDIVDSNGERQYMHMGYGGFLMGLTFGSDKMIHWGFQQTIGGGNAMLSPDRWDDGEEDRHHDEDHMNWRNTQFFAWEPELRAEINVTSWMRIAAGAGYRFTWIEEEKNGYDKNDLGGVTGSLALKFGKF